MITAEMIAIGKPDPECYRTAFERLGLGVAGSERPALVLEDAPAGVKAGKAAGFRVLALATTHAVGEMREAGADWIVRDLRSVAVGGFEKGSGVLSIEIRDVIING